MSNEKKGTGKVLQKMYKSIEDGNHYEAQQMYKTLYFRYIGQSKHEEAKKLLVDGSCNMLKFSHFNEGAELGLLVINIYKDTQAQVNSETLEPLIKIFQLFPDSSEARLAKESFMKAAIKWSSNNGSNEGHPTLHTLFAKSYQKQQDFGKAQFHFIRGSDPEEFSKMLIEWTQRAYSSEHDLFLARVVLQYLCLSNLRDANIIFENFVKLSVSLPQTPLINFLRFLLLTLERDAYPLFDNLRQKYKPTLDRDPSFQQYLDHIAFSFFGVKIASSNFLADFMKSFLSGGVQEVDDELD